VSYADRSSIGDLTRGGQLLLHFLRMFGQVVRKFGLAALLLAVVIGAGLYWMRTQTYQRYLGFEYAVAWLNSKSLGGDTKPLLFRRPDGSMMYTTSPEIQKAPAVVEASRHLLSEALKALRDAGAGVGVVFLMILVRIWRSGITQRVEQQIRGSEIVEGATLRQVLESRKISSDLSVAGVPLIKGSETSHLLISGSPGTGKSTAIHELLARIRERGDRCICYSPSGDFIQWFYREGRDRVLNPFDQRCPSWDLWAECTEPYHHDMIAASVVPDPARVSDPFWNTAARAVISSLTQKMADRGERSISRMLELLTKVDLDVLYEYLLGTEGAALIDPAGERTAVSIRTNAATYARAFRYLPLYRDNFHIRKWVHDESGGGWIFLNAQREQLDAVRPVLSAWLEIFTNALTSLAPSRTRRVWLVIDELHSLNRISSLEPFLAEGRKYGGCGVIGFHQVAQLRERYGKDCATWVCLRQNDPETAKWMAGSFGQIEIFETHQGLTYGANDVRDGVSLSKVRKFRPLLLDSEISNLDDLEGYMRVPGRLPVAHFKQRWRPTPNVAPAFMPGPAASVELNAPADGGDLASAVSETPAYGESELPVLGLFDEPPLVRPAATALTTDD
jgi:type IV conjugative transfer system coupling protein TraD